MVRIFWSILVCPFVMTKGKEPSWTEVPVEPLMNDYVEVLLVNETSNFELAPFLLKEMSRNSKGGLTIDYSMQFGSSVDFGLFVLAACLVAAISCALPAFVVAAPVPWGPALFAKLWLYPGCFQTWNLDGESVFTYFQLYGGFLVMLAKCVRFCAGTFLGLSWAWWRCWRFSPETGFNCFIFSLTWCWWWGFHWVFRTSPSSPFPPPSQKKKCGVRPEGECGAGESRHGQATFEGLYQDDDGYVWSRVRGNGAVYCWNTHTQHTQWRNSWTTGTATTSTATANCNCNWSNYNNNNYNYNYKCNYNYNNRKNYNWNNWNNYNFADNFNLHNYN